MQPPRVDVRDEYLRVTFPGSAGETADFHYFWLRHNCDCCRHPMTRERTICSSSIPLQIRPSTVAAGAEALTVTWNEERGEHRSIYTYEWLREHAYALGRADVPPPASDAKALEVDAGNRATPALHRACLERVDAAGAVIVRAAGLDTDELIDGFAACGYAVVPTHFGRIEDLRTDNTTNQNTDQLGYTDDAVNLHTDQPFLEEPPHYQMLHCMRQADRGGENAVVDGRQAAEYLHSLDAEAFELLATVPVRFLRQQKKFQKELVSPIVELRAGRVHRLRSSYFTMAPHTVPFARMEAWYRAYNRFARLVNDPAHQYRFLLGAGDFLLYDNHRMLHARTRFDGPRWLRGVYFNRNEENRHG